MFVEFTRRAIDFWRKYLHGLEPVEKDFVHPGQLCQVSEKFREVLDTRLPSLYAPVSSLARWLDMIKLAQYAGLIN